MRHCTFLFALIVTLAVALCAQPVTATPFSESLLGGGDFNAIIDASDGIGQISHNAGNDSLYLGGNEPVTIFMKIDIGVNATSATITTGGDIATNTIGTGSGGYLSVGSGLVDAGDPSQGLVNETVLITQGGGGDWPDLSSVDISAAVAGSSEIWLAMHANQDSWRNYGARVYSNATLNVSGEGTAIIPEPATMLLLGSGLTCLMLVTRRRK
jgi:hypothetical protein